MRTRGGDGEADTISVVVVVPDSDGESTDKWESVSDGVADKYSDISSDIRDSMGVGEAVSEDVSDADIETKNCSLGRGGSRLMEAEAVGAGEAVTENIAGVDIDTMCLCWLIC
jgi:hypothetical protein